MVEVDAACPEALAAGQSGYAGAFGIVDLGGRHEAAGGAGTRGAELVDVAGVGLHGVKAEAERAGQSAVYSGIAAERSTAATAVELGGGDVVAAAGEAAELEDHHGDRAGNGGRPIVAAVDLREGKSLTGGIRVDDVGPVVLRRIGGVDGEKETGAGVGQARGGDTKQAEGYDVAGLHIELIAIDLAARTRWRGCRRESVRRTGWYWRRTGG